MHRIVVRNLSLRLISVLYFFNSIYFILKVFNIYCNWFLYKFHVYVKILAAITELIAKGLDLNTRVLLIRKLSEFSVNRLRLECEEALT